MSAKKPLTKSRRRRNRRRRRCAKPVVEVRRGPRWSVRAACALAALAALAAIALSFMF